MEMIDFNSIIKLINTNNDTIISKTEIETYLKEHNSESIFSSYLSSIKSDTEITSFYDNMEQIEKTAKEKEYNEAKADKKHFEKEGYFPYDNQKSQPKIAKKLEDIPMRSPHCRDARGCDISQSNISKEELLNLTIDKSTILSPEQQAIITEYTEKMKDPGLGIRKLHMQGFTGKGIKMAIIDQPLGKHKEYSDNISEHHDINITASPKIKAQLHGAAVTSIAVGKTTGVAPDAKVSYYSAWNISQKPQDIDFYKRNILQEIENNKEHPQYVENLKEQLKKIEKDGACLSNQPFVDAINKILDANKKLPENERIPVVSISWGFEKLAPGYKELQQALKRAKEENLFIVSTAMEQHYGISTCGANRNPQADPNDSKSYEAGAFWKKQVKTGPGSKEFSDQFLLFPMDHRSVADYTDDSSYRYEGNDGGMSWSTPWIAGTYVLAKQANPNITPEEFWRIALETSDECRNNDDNTYVGRLINPQKLIETISKGTSF